MASQDGVSGENREKRILGALPEQGISCLPLRLLTQNATGTETNIQVHIQVFCTWKHHSCSSWMRWLPAELIFCFFFWRKQWSLCPKLAMVEQGDIASNYTWSLTEPKTFLNPIIILQSSCLLHKNQQKTKQELQQNISFRRVTWQNALMHARKYGSIFYLHKELELFIKMYFFKFPFIFRQTLILYLIRIHLHTVILNVFATLTQHDAPFTSLLRFSAALKERRVKLRESVRCSWLWKERYECLEVTDNGSEESYS